MNRETRREYRVQAGNSGGTHRDNSQAAAEVEPSGILGWDTVGVHRPIDATVEQRAGFESAKRTQSRESIVPASKDCRQKGQDEEEMRDPRELAADLEFVKALAREAAAVAMERSKRVTPVEKAN